MHPLLPIDMSSIMLSKLQNVVPVNRPKHCRLNLKLCKQDMQTNTFKLVFLNVDWAHNIPWGI